MNEIDLALRLAQEGISERTIKILSSQYPVLESLQKYWNKITSLPMPSLQSMDSLIRHTLRLNEMDRIEKKHVIAAVVSAALTPLRQTVGSCFATAPAIFVQRYRIDLFIDDFRALLVHGRLSRVIEGREILAPLCPLEAPDPGDHSLLKAWEYTLASFCDYKVRFFEWNLLMCLGLDPKEEGGIGHVIYEMIDAKLQKHNKSVQELQQDMETAAYFYQADPSNLSKKHQYELCQHSRDLAHQIAEKYAGFFNFIIERYRSYFSEFFQDLYDPKMVAERGEIYDDRPAGFRLVYKHGRVDPKAWTRIYNQDQYLKVLHDFFRVCESRLEQDCDWQLGKEEIAEITTAIIHQLDHAQFLPTAFQRAKNLHKKARTGAQMCTPWSYLSGGSMENLLRCYFKVEGKLRQEQKTINDPTELLSFFIETLKNTPAPLIQSSMFAYSPTHAFSLLTQIRGFAEAWQNKAFTYTWVRDAMVQPAKKQLDSIVLSPDEQMQLIREGGYQAKPNNASLSIREFRNHLVDAWAINPHYIDSFMVKKWQMKPLFFADTNWKGLLFAFAYNPGIASLDLWRADPEFLHPIPMHIWRAHLNGSSGEPWGLILHRF